MKLTNAKIRPNTDETNKSLLGWGECLDSESGMFYNNIKIKLKPKDENGSLRITLDFPSKTAIMQDRVEKKIFYVKPINSEAYKHFEDVFISCIKSSIGGKNESKGNV